MKINLDQVIRSVAGEDPNKLVHVDLIKQQLAAIDQTPDHPVYSALIQEALAELNGGNGSSREAISHFIASKYDVLPIIHSGKLIEQLDNLVKRKEVLITFDNCYILPGEGDGVVPKPRKGNKRSRWNKQVHKGSAVFKIEGAGQIEEGLGATKVKEQSLSVKSWPPYEFVDFTNIQGCSQVEKICHEPQGRELEYNTKQDRQHNQLKDDSNSNSASGGPEHSTHKLEEDKDMIITSSPSPVGQKLDLGQLLLKFDCKKEVYVDLLKKIIVLRQELMENIEYMSFVESRFPSSQPSIRELVMALQSEIKAILHSNSECPSFMQEYDQKQLQPHHENLSFEGHELCHAQKLLKCFGESTFPDVSLELRNFDLMHRHPELRMDVDNLQQEQQGLANLKMALEEETCVTEPESPSEDIPPGFGSILGPEQHKGMHHLVSHRHSGVANLDMDMQNDLLKKEREWPSETDLGVEHNMSTMESDLMAEADISVDEHEVEHNLLVDFPRSESCLSPHSQSQIEETPQSFEKMAEHSLMEQPKGDRQYEMSSEDFKQNYEVTVSEQLCQGFHEEVTLIGKSRKHPSELRRGGNHGVLSHDEPVSTGKTCLTELQMQREDSGTKMRKTSASGSGVPSNMHVEQPIDMGLILDEVVRGPSQPVNREERASNFGLPPKVDQRRRQLRPRTAKSCVCDQSHVEVTPSDVDMVLLPNRRSKKKIKPESAIPKGKERCIIVKDETPEHSGRLKKARSGELVRMQPKQQRQKEQAPSSQPKHCSGKDAEGLMESKQRELSSPPSQPEQCSGDDVESLHTESRQDDPPEPSQREPADLIRVCHLVMPVVEIQGAEVAAKGTTFPDLTGKELIQFHGDQYRKERAGHPQGRSRKLVDSAATTVKLRSSSKVGAKQTEGQSLDQSEGRSPKSRLLELDQSEGRSPKSKLLATATASSGKIVLALSREYGGRITRARTAACAAAVCRKKMDRVLASPLPSPKCRRKRKPSESC